MAVSPNPPLISALPPAPLPTDAEAVFDAKAGARLTAEEVMVTEQNAALTWQAGSMAETKDHRDAAVLSKTAAADSAESSRVEAGKSRTEREAAETARTDAQVIAASMQSAPGFPALAGHGGHAMRVKLNETGVEFAEVGQEIGDVLFTRRATPPPGYVLSGTVYAQAAYPELFAVTGLREVNRDLSNLRAEIPFTGSPILVGMVVGKDGVIVCTGYRGYVDGATAAFAQRSTDNGVTWTPIAGLNAAVYSLAAPHTDGNGMWLVAGYYGALYRSTDNGLTFTVISTWTGVWYSSVQVKVVTNGKGRWFITAYGSATGSTSAAGLLVSNDNGATFTLLARPGYYVTLALDGAGNLYLGESNNAVYRSTDNGLTWGYNATGGPAGYPSALRFNGGVGVYLREQDVYLTEDFGVSWRRVLASASQCYIDTDSTIYAMVGSNNLLRSYDLGVTWSDSWTTVNPYLYSGAVSHTSDGNYISVFGSQQVIKGSRQYNYDKATQFKTPRAKAPFGLYAYIKAKKV